MATANLPIEQGKFVEILDEEFAQYLEVAQSILKTLKRPKDKRICIKYIKKCLNLDAPNIEVKSHRNEFFKYFLRMLQTTAITQPPQYDSWESSCYLMLRDPPNFTNISTVMCDAIIASEGRILQNTS